MSQSIKDIDTVAATLAAATLKKGAHAREIVQHFLAIREELKTVTTTKPFVPGEGGSEREPQGRRAHQSTW